MSPQTALGDLDAGLAAALIAAASDVTLIADADGVILDMSIQIEELLTDLDGGRDWIGNVFAATVAADSRPKVLALMQDAARAEPKWRQVNHLASDGRSIPVLYCCVQLGQEGRMVLFGRDLRALSALQKRLMNAQASLEENYSRLRDAEMRYRLLFQTSSEAVLILEPVSGRVLEANPAAREMFGAELREVVGHGLLPLIVDPEAAQAYLAAVRAGETPEDLKVRLVHAGREVVLRATAFRQEQTTMLLVRITSVHAVAAASSLSAQKLKLLRAVESAPDGFVVTESDGTIVTANASFLDMAGLAAEEVARGQSLDRWVGESPVDMTVLIANLRQRGVVRFYATTLRTESGGSLQVEISAVAARLACLVMGLPQVVMVLLLAQWGRPWFALGVAALVMVQAGLMVRFLPDLRRLAPLV